MIFFTVFYPDDVDLGKELHVLDISSHNLTISCVDYLIISGRSRRVCDGIAFAFRMVSSDSSGQPYLLNAVDKNLYGCVMMLVVVAQSTQSLCRQRRGIPSAVRAIRLLPPLVQAVISFWAVLILSPFAICWYV